MHEIRAARMKLFVLVVASDVAAKTSLRRSFPKLLGWDSKIRPQTEMPI